MKKKSSEIEMKLSLISVSKVKHYTNKLFNGQRYTHTSHKKKR